MPSSLLQILLVESENFTAQSAGAAEFTDCISAEG